MAPLNDPFKEVEPRTISRLKLAVAASAGIVLVAVGIVVFSRPGGETKLAGVGPMLPIAPRALSLEAARPEPQESGLWRPLEEEEAPVESLEFKDFFNYLAAAAEKPQVGPIAKKIAHELSASPGIRKTYQEFEERAARGERPTAKAFMNAVRRNPAFQKMALELPGRAGAAGAFAALAREPGLKDFLGHEVRAFAAAAKEARAGRIPNAPNKQAMVRSGPAGSAAFNKGDLSALAAASGIAGGGAATGGGGGAMGGGGSFGQSSANLGGGSSGGGGKGGGGGGGKNLANEPGAGDGTNSKSVSRKEDEKKDAHTTIQLPGAPAAGIVGDNEQVVNGRVKALLEVYPWLIEVGPDILAEAVKKGTQGNLIYDYGTWGACFALPDPAPSVAGASMYDKCYQACQRGQDAAKYGDKRCSTTRPTAQQAWGFCLDFAKSDDQRCLGLCNKVRSAQCTVDPAVVKKYCDPEWKKVIDDPKTGEFHWEMGKGPPNSECSRDQILQYSNASVTAPCGEGSACMQPGDFTKTPAPETAASPTPTPETPAAEKPLRDLTWQELNVLRDQAWQESRKFLEPGKYDYEKYKEQIEKSLGYSNEILTRFPNDKAARAYVVNTLTDAGSGWKQDWDGIVNLTNKAALYAGAFPAMAAVAYEQAAIFARDMAKRPGEKYADVYNDAAKSFDEKAKLAKEGKLQDWAPPEDFGY